MEWWQYKRYFRANAGALLKEKSLTEQSMYIMKKNNAYSGTCLNVCSCWERYLLSLMALKRTASNTPL